MTRVLVTGASGFIGRHVLAPLKARGYEVHGQSRRDMGADPTWHRADLCDCQSMARLVQTIRPTHLLHFAWYAEHGRFWSAPENFRWVGATLSLLEAFREAGGSRAVIAGSCAEYDFADGICDEVSTALRPSSVYGICKNATRSLFEAYCNQSGLSGAWGRIFHLFGPYEHPERLVSSVCIALLRGEDALCSHGRQLRDFLHVADVADAFAALLDSELEGAVNIGSGAPITVGALSAGIADVIGRPAALKLGARPATFEDPPSIVPTLRRLREELRWAALESFETRMATTIEWWRAKLLADGGRKF